MLLLDDAKFRHYFAGTPVRRAGYDRFMRNILIAAGNSDDTALVPLVRTYLDYQSAVVRAMAVWALSQLMDQQRGLLSRISIYRLKWMILSQRMD